MADPPDAGGLSPEQRTWLGRLPDFKLPEPALQVGPQVAPPRIGGDLHLTLPGVPPPTPPAAPPPPSLLPPIVPPMPGPQQPPSPFLQPPSPAAPAPAGGGDGLQLERGRFNLGLGTDIPARLPGINPPPADDPAVTVGGGVRVGPATFGVQGQVDTGGGLQGTGGVTIPLDPLFRPTAPPKKGD